MAHEHEVDVKLTLSPAAIWKIIEGSVLDAAFKLEGERPNGYAPINHWIFGEDGLVKYYGYLQRLLTQRGLAVAVTGDPPPLSYEDAVKGNFITMMIAVRALVK